MQNLSTTHAAEIRDRDEIFVPAGGGKTNFVDARDLGEAAAHMLAGPGKHLMRAYDLTGPASFTYGEVAAILTRELGREIRYARPSKVRFLIRKLREKTPLMFTLVMIYLYHQTVSGAADSFSPELGELLGRPPTSLEQFVREHRHIWMPR
jgi:nucleoside-diphosphate-sugar epimerase